MLRWAHYTIPRTVRELQQRQEPSLSALHYTIPRTVRELQLCVSDTDYYTIPRTVKNYPDAAMQSAHGYYTECHERAGRLPKTRNFSRVARFFQNNACPFHAFACSFPHTARMPSPALFIRPKFPATAPSPATPTAALGCISTLLYILSSNVSKLSTHRRSSLQTAPFFRLFRCRQARTIHKTDSPAVHFTGSLRRAAIFLRQHRTIHG